MSEARPDNLIAESEERLKLALEGGDLGFWDWDMVSDKMLFNERLENMLGYDAGEVKPHFDFWLENIHPQDKDRVLELWNDHVQGKDPSFSAEFRMKAKNGTWIWVLDKGRIITRDTEGKPLRAVGTHMNITLRKQQEAELKERERIFNWLTEYNTDGWWDWNLETNEEYMSPGFKKLFGYEDHEMENKPESWQKIIYPEDLELAQENFNRHINSDTKEPFFQEVRYKCKDGSTKWVVCRGIALKNHQGKYDRMVGTHFDITSLKEIEKSLILQTVELEESKKELERSNHELENFAFVASHDLREPLRMIANYVDLFQSDLKNKGVDFDENLEKYFFYVSDGVQRMNKMIKDILNYSLLGKDVEMTQSSLKELLDLALKNLEASIEERQANIIIEGEFPNLNLCQSEIIQVFQNIISNAIKFVPKDKKPEVKIISSIKDEYVLLAIKDNGIGVKEEYHARIFQIFQRLDRSQQFPGSGIGLSSCKKIIENHKGLIWLESEPDKGTTFFFTLPYISK